VLPQPMRQARAWRSAARLLNSVSRASAATSVEFGKSIEDRTSLSGVLVSRRTGSDLSERSLRSLPSRRRGWHWVIVCCRFGFMICCSIAGGNCRHRTVWIERRVAWHQQAVHEPMGVPPPAIALARTAAGVLPLLAR
jgi:hypothetical protein